VLLPFLAFLSVLAPGCTEPRATRIAPPLENVGNAWEAAARIELAQVPPIEHPGLHNVYRLSDQVISGGEPLSREAFERLRAMGVRTILSVDGKAPDAATAEEHGMRYVHVPIRYQTISENELLKIVKTFRELEGPFYVHCFHGKHRGPAAAAIGRLVLDGASREQALAEMRQWCQTSPKYEGLYRVVATAELPSDVASRSLDWDFAARHRPAGLRKGMVDAARVFDRIEILAHRDFAPDPEHPDLVAREEIRQMEDLLRDMRALPESREHGERFDQMLGESIDVATRMREGIETLERGGEIQGDSPKDLLERLDALCSSCHAEFRN